jgi:hypothetical protein
VGGVGGVTGNAARRDRGRVQEDIVVDEESEDGDTDQ